MIKLPQIVIEDRHRGFEDSLHRYGQKRRIAVGQLARFRESAEAAIRELARIAKGGSSRSSVG
jgi:hypothetical protein